MEGYLIGKTTVSVTDILTDCLEASKARQSQKGMNEVVRRLQRLGWRMRQVRRPDGKRERVYEKR